MKTLRMALMTALAGFAVGCANEPRSRDTANPNVSGETLALQVCSNCHGAGGSSKSPNFPNLAGQQQAYLVTQLQGFKGHSRTDPAGFEYMWGLSRRLTDKQIQELAAHYAALVPERQPVEGRAERIAAGKIIFSSGIADKKVPPCATCHGAEGKGNATFPRIAGQHADYLAKQLAVFQRTGERPAGAVMQVVAHELSAENIQDVAAYLQALPNQ
jgi:cytochrome c553